MNLTSNRPKYKSIKIRVEDFVRLKNLAHKRGEKLVDLFSSIIKKH